MLCHKYLSIHLVVSRNGWLEIDSYNTFLECFDRTGQITRVFVTVFPVRAGVR